MSLVQKQNSGRLELIVFSFSFVIILISSSRKFSKVKVLEMIVQINLNIDQKHMQNIDTKHHVKK